MIIEKVKPRYDDTITKRMSYDSFKPDENGEYFTSNLWTGSDYSGCSVTRANYCILKGMQDAIDIYGGYNTYSVVFPIKALENEELKKIIDNLEDYPVINEDELHLVEQETFDIYWESCGEAEFIQEFEERNIDIEGIDNLIPLFYAMLEAANEEVIIEQGCQAYVDIEKIFKNIEDVEGFVNKYKEENKCTNS